VFLSLSHRKLPGLPSGLALIDFASTAALGLALLLAPAYA
jgi:hypothetical protein